MTLPLPAKNSKDWFPWAQSVTDQLNVGGATGAALDRPGGFQSPGVRRASFSWGCGNGGTFTDRDAGHQRLPIVLPVATKRWRLRISNKDQSGLTTGAGNVNIPSVWIGESFRNTDTGDVTFWAGLTQALTASPTLAVGQEWVTPWVEAANLQLSAPGRMYTLSMEWTKAAGSTVYYGAGGSWYSTDRADVGVTVPNTNMTYFEGVAFAVSLEYEFVGTNKVLVAVGDSITEGVGSRFNFMSWHQRASMRLGMPTCLSAATGAFAQGGAFTNSYGGGALTEPRWQRLRDADCNIDAAIVHLGTNETAWGGTLEGYRSGTSVTYNRIRSEWGVRDVYGSTLAPRSLPAGGPETLRLDINSYLRSGQPFYTDVFDFAALMETAPNGPTLRPDYVGPNTDTTHWGPVGQQRASQAVLLAS